MQPFYLPNRQTRRSLFARFFPSKSVDRARPDPRSNTRPDGLGPGQPAKHWSTYSAQDIDQACEQHDDLCLNARQALLLDVLCACKDVCVRATKVRWITNGGLTLGQLSYLTNMTLDEAVPELFQMAMRSEPNFRRGAYNKPTKDYYYVRSDGQIIFSPQLLVDVCAENDPCLSDSEYLYAQERGCFSPPSIGFPRTVVFDYWLDVGPLYEDAYDEDDSSKTDELDALINELALAAQRRAGFQPPGDFPPPGAGC